MPTLTIDETTAKHLMRRLPAASGRMSALINSVAQELCIPTPGMEHPLWGWARDVLREKREEDAAKRGARPYAE